MCCCRKALVALPGQVPRAPQRPGECAGLASVPGSMVVSVRVRSVTSALGQVWCPPSGERGHQGCLMPSSWCSTTAVSTEWVLTCTVSMLKSVASFSRS